MSFQSNKSLLEIYFSFAFIICLCPFTFRNASVGQKPKIIKYYIQCVICVLVALLDFYGSITRIRLSTEKPLNNPVAYFKFMWSIASTSMHISFYYVLWRNKHQICQTVELLHRNLRIHKRLTACLWQLATVILCCISLVFAILPTLKGSGILPSEISWSATALFQSHIQRSKFVFFLTNFSEIDPMQINAANNFSQHFNGTDQYNSSVSALEVFLGVGHIFVHTFRYVGAYFIELLLDLACITLWIAVSEFQTSTVIQNVDKSKSIEEEELHYLRRREISSGLSVSTANENESACSLGDSTLATPVESGQAKVNLNQTIEKYYELKILSDSLNFTINPIMFLYVFELIFYYATNLNEIFAAKDWLSMLQVSHFLLATTTVFGLSADICRKMESFSLWLSQQQNNSDQLLTVENVKRLPILIHELQHKPVSISPYGIFTIDFPLIFNITTTTVTFFLIVVQFVPTECN